MDCPLYTVQDGRIVRIAGHDDVLGVLRQRGLELTVQNEEQPHQKGSDPFRCAFAEHDEQSVPGTGYS
ncbi:MAG TPA: hypothetical protein VGL44_06805 [Gaiellales bacterium]